MYVFIFWFVFISGFVFFGDFSEGLLMFWWKLREGRGKGERELVRVWGWVVYMVVN